MMTEQRTGTAGSDAQDASVSPCPREAVLRFSPLLHQLARTFWAFKQAYAGELDLSAIAVGVLATLAERDGLTQQELTNALRLDPSMITRTVRELADERGWLTRARDPADKRLMRVYLTAEGRARAADLPARARAIEQRLLRDLTEEQSADLRRTLRALEERSRQHQTDLID